ncbi:hypothetical protein TELCIR_00242 [Teladorsagia circumcincta]|uniref:G-protein coupled receptors family 1 profile domain-containing protein n=1 Tax=Teladorsagia circumcincta TaxID=45464 RepID=A0A2G9V6Q0_TELCI|nr:hypothetical protein TELCIR_00242 [Teladorsagia circumcincta]
MLATTSGTALLPVGPCHLFGPMTCFVTSNVIMALTMHAELLIVYTMFCRYRMLQCTEMRTQNVVLGYVMMAILPTILLILPHTGSLRFDLVMEQAIREHPEHNLEK